MGPSGCPGGGFPPLPSTQVIGHSNFGTIRSTTCVYKGEAMLRCSPASAGRFKGPGLMAEAVFVYLLGLTWLFPGKWVYEVLISSQGLMQIGWCTINCRFNQEVRVGGAWPPQGHLLLQPPDCGGSAQDPQPTTL